ncbi:MAG: molybdenum cofactor biosynthesis protein B [Rickettsiales bacterium]|nr:molybdenum cofactor biosynthesis protein B [Rickettsiales bacterium]|tara:strand:+ start:328 stop:855 length:528 start_codon:yes stop_codon:yes gene_type:complete
MPIDPERAFQPVRIAILTISDRRKLSDDRSGDVLVQRAQDAGHELADRKLVTDDPNRIAAQVRSWLDRDDVDVIIATGGTGITGRDSTPEVFNAIYEKEIPGFGELFRWLSYTKIGTSTIQSRASAGVAQGTYLFSLPGSPGACKDAWDDILATQLDSRFRPCNFVELMPRLMET